MHGMFTGRVNCIRGGRNQPSHRAHVDDMPRALLDHHRQSLPRRLDDTQHIDIEL